MRPERPMMSAPCSRAAAEDLLRRDHHPEVDHLVVVAAQDDADDVLADVVHVALDRGHDDLRLGLGPARPLLRLEKRRQVGDRLLHHPGALDHLRQEHLARAEEVADDVHARHERALDHRQRPAVLLPGLLGVLLDERVDAPHEGVRQPLLDRALPPGVLDRRPLLLRLHRLREGDQPLGGVGPAVQQHVLDPLQQVLRDLLVDRELAGVDDAHVEAGLDGVVEEGRVHRLAHRVVAAEGERDVADAAAHLGEREGLLDPARGLDEVHGVVGVLLDAGPHGQHVRVEDDVLGGKPTSSVRIR